MTLIELPRPSGRTLYQELSPYLPHRAIEILCASLAMNDDLPRGRIGIRACLHELDEYMQHEAVSILIDIIAGEDLYQSEHMLRAQGAQLCQWLPQPVSDLIGHYIETI